jgi:putative Mg2+ transporter-C (MgtC) family protein
MFELNVEFMQAILTALALGSLVGVERQWHKRLVDLKTNALVALGACLFLWICKTSEGYTDAVRMAGQIVVGVGFIGGGLLYRDGTLTRGVNTAATLWCCAAVGALCGLQRPVEALIASLVIVTANSTLRALAYQLNLKMGLNDYLSESIYLTVICSQDLLESLGAQTRALIRSAGAELLGVSTKKEGSSEVQLSFTVSLAHTEPTLVLNSWAKSLMDQGATEVNWCL